jgi:hypothetical protein
MLTTALVPGDCLCYSGRGPLSWAIKVKTWSQVSHVEGYAGDGHVVAARATGVRTYHLTDKDLVAVLRPSATMDVPAAMRWFHDHANGQRYDTLGLFRFYTLGRQSMDKQFCSELLTRWYRAGGFHPFAQRYDADLVSPGMFACSPLFEEVT